jgi:hypothetical protein
VILTFGAISCACPLEGSYAKRRRQDIKKRREILASYNKARKTNAYDTSTTTDFSVASKTRLQKDGIVGELDAVHGSLNIYRLHYCITSKCRGAN